MQDRKAMTTCCVAGALRLLAARRYDKLKTLRLP